MTKRTKDGPPIDWPCIKCGATNRNASGSCRPCIKAANTKYRLENPEKFKKYSTTAYIKNADKRKAEVQIWALENKEKRRISAENRRARKRNAGGSLSSDLASRLLILQKGKCPCCSQPLGIDYHLDHITPISRGGRNVDANIQLLRSICNLQKHTKHPIDFMQSRGFLL